MQDVFIILTTGTLGGLERRIITSTRIFQPTFILFADPSHELHTLINLNSSNSFVCLAPKILCFFPPFIHIYNFIRLGIYYFSNSSQRKGFIISTSLYGSYYSSLLVFFTGIKHILVIGTSVRRYAFAHSLCLQLSLRTSCLALTNSIETFRCYSNHKQIVYTFDKPTYLPRFSLLSRSSDESLRILIVANMRPVKNPDGTAFFINSIANKLTNVSFTLIGRSMNRVTKNLSSEALKISFDAGPLPHHKVLELMAGSHFLLSLSKHEGMPNSVLEALSIGIIPILSNIEPHRLLLFNGYEDYLVNLNDLEKEVDRILPLISHKACSKFRSIPPFSSVDPFVLSSPATHRILADYFTDKLRT